MDGSFVAHGLRSAEEGGPVTVNLGSREREALHGSVVVEREALAQSLREAARAIANECRRNGWEVPELHKLDRIAER